MTPADVVRLEVSEHAAERFVQRRGSTSVARAEADLLAMAAEGKEVQPPAGWALRGEIDRRHGRKGPQTYVRSGAGWLIVIRDTPDNVLLVVTVLPPKAGEWWT